MISYWDIWLSGLPVNVTAVALFLLLGLLTSIGFGAAVGWVIGSFIGAGITYRAEKRRYRELR